MTDLIFRKFLATVSNQRLVVKKPRKFRKWLSKCTCELFWKYSDQFIYLNKKGHHVFFEKTRWQDLAYVQKNDMKIACALSAWLQQIEINWRSHISWAVWNLSDLQKQELLLNLQKIKNKATGKSRFGWWRPLTIIQNLESLTLRDLLQFYELLPAAFQNLHLQFSSSWTICDFRQFWLKTIAVRNQTAHLRNVFNWKYRVCRSESDNQSFWLIDYLKLTLDCTATFDTGPLKNANRFLKKITKRVLSCKIRNFKTTNNSTFTSKIKQKFSSLKVHDEVATTSPLGHL